jgi:hypothetical protein
MAIKIRCNNPDCRKIIECPDESAGQVVDCSSCGKKLRVPDRTLGDYKIIREIGEGGTGSVYEGLQTRLNRKVALKVLSGKLAKDNEFLARFHREAQAAAALNHSNIVQVFDIGEEEGKHFFAMEFVDGEDLRAKLDREGKLAVDEALSIAARRCSRPSGRAGAIDHAFEFPEPLRVSRNRSETNQGRANSPSEYWRRDAGSRSVPIAKHENRSAPIGTKLSYRLIPDQKLNT